VTISSRITGLLTGLPRDARFRQRQEYSCPSAKRKEILGHPHTKHADGTHTTDWYEETWHLPGAAGKLTFNEELLERHLADVTGLLRTLASAACEFTERHQPARTKS
jgi:hypothetical protein